jgi:hypothetical protein
VIELAPEHRDKPPALPTPARPMVALGAGKVPDEALVRGLTEKRLQSAAESTAHTSIGGYGELYVTGVAAGKDASRKWTGDVSRLVLFVAHSFTDTIRAYTEIEVEHAKQIEIEQAYVDWQVLGDYLGLRAGLVLIPMGTINQWHEPPIFQGVIRPRVETEIIPSTWRELGAGVFGKPREWLRYEAYAVTGLNPLGITAGGIKTARGNGSFANAKAWAFTGRVEVEPLLGVVAGVAVYGSDLGKNGEYFLRDKKPASVKFPIIGWAADARWRRSGLEWKIVYSEWYLPEAQAIMSTFDAAGQPLVPDTTRPVPTRIRGAYVEGGYDVLRPFGVSHQLVPFARVELYDTQAAVPEGFKPHASFDIREYTFGASYRPIQQVVVKGDYQLMNRRAGKDETQINFGVGFMY